MTSGDTGEPAKAEDLITRKGGVDADEVTDRLYNTQITMATIDPDRDAVSFFFFNNLENHFFFCTRVTVLNLPLNLTSYALRSIVYFYVLELFQMTSSFKLNLIPKKKKKLQQYY